MTARSVRAGSGSPPARGHPVVTSAAAAGSRQQAPSALPGLPGVMGTHPQTEPREPRGRDSRLGICLAAVLAGGPQLPGSHRPPTAHLTQAPWGALRASTRAPRNVQATCVPVSHMQVHSICIHVHMGVHTNTCARVCTCKQAHWCAHTMFFWVCGCLRARVQRQGRGQAESDPRVFPARTRGSSEASGWIRLPSVARSF